MKLTRKEFLKKSAIGAAALAIGSKIAIPSEVEAGTSNSGGVTISDNQTESGIYKGATPPDNLNKIWLCTHSQGSYYEGVEYYHNGSSWVPTVSTWA